MRSLVTIFVGLLMVYSLYLLSFTWFVNNHEKAIEAKAVKFVNSQYPQTAEQKYPGNDNARVLYQDTLDQALKQRRQTLLDSTKDQSITWWGTTYQKAKESELLLGLDLQGGINVTMDIELAGLIKGLANNPGDPALNKALAEATHRKTNSDVDYITLFSQSFKAVNPGTPLAPLFANSTKNKLKIDASDNTVIGYIREEANASMKQTYNVLTKRIDKFGVAQPNINLDESKGIITVELAGADDPERVRKYLQSTANLQFFAVYNISELDKSLEAADKALAVMLNGSAPAAAVDPTPTPKVATDTSTAKPDTAQKSLADLVNATQDTKTKVPDVANAKNEHPLISGIIQFIPPQDNNKDGKPEYASAIGYVALKDTSVVNSYLQNPAVVNNMPADAKFVYGMAEKDKNGKVQNFIPLYAIKTIPGSDKAELEGDHIIDASQDCEHDHGQTG
jgi:SecD/SecF fusion protein